MNKYHNYDPGNTDFCKECKRIYALHGDSDAQVEDYHQIVPLDMDNLSPDSEYTELPELYSPYKEILRDNISTPVIAPIPPLKSASMKKHSHVFDYKNIGKCKECKRLDRMFGLVDAQPDYNPHTYQPIRNKRKSHKKNKGNSKKQKKGGRKTQKQNRGGNKKTAKN